MEAPDKIYLQTCGECHGLECDTCRFEELGEVSWCEDRIYEETISWYYKKMQHVTGSVGNNNTAGKLDAYKQLIEKIESL